MAPCEHIVVVIVDDDASFRTGVAANLRDDGHRVHDYADPRQVASERLAGARVVVTDYHMAETDGIAFADGVHRDHPDVAIVLVTAYWTIEVEDAVASRPFLSLCRKPVDYDDLHTRVHEVIHDA